MFRKVNSLFVALSLLFMVPFTLGIEGCTHFGDAPATSEEYFQRYEAIIQLGVQVAVINLLETNPTYVDRVVKFSDYMVEYLQGEGEVVDLTTLEEVIRSKIDWSGYHPTERAFVEALIVTTRSELENVIRANGVDVPDAPEKVKFYGTKFLSWVGQAAKMFNEQSRDLVPILPIVE